MFLRPRTFAQALAGYQLTGCLYGLFLLPELPSPTRSLAWGLVWLLVIALLAGLATSATLFWIDHPLAIRVFRWTQYPQVPQVVWPGWAWSIFTPAKVAVGIGPSILDLGFNAQFGPSVTIHGLPSTPVFVGVNVMPLIAWWMMRRTFPAPPTSEATALTATGASAT